MSVDCKHDWKVEDTTHRVCRKCGATEWRDDRHKLHYTTADGIPFVWDYDGEKAVQDVDKYLKKLRKSE